MSHHCKTCHSNSLLANFLHEVHSEIRRSRCRGRFFITTDSEILKRSKLRFVNFLVKVLQMENCWISQIGTMHLTIYFRLSEIGIITCEAVLFFWKLWRHATVRYNRPGNDVPLATGNFRNYGRTETAPDSVTLMQCNLDFWRHHRRLSASCFIKTRLRHKIELKSC